MASSIQVTSQYVPALNSSFPGLAFQVTSLVDSYMIWIGTMPGSSNDVQLAVANGRLVQDWACAMPPSKTTASTPGTALFRPSNTGIALPMAQRLALRFKKQIFISIDFPPAFMTMSDGTTLAFEAEKQALAILKKLEQH
ncbi:hypothetical protein BU17DRAFT_46552 [Hysterangium stoloniferum]|nr:hypothetical protein BU17DRAFT_46552 [Hysterangium stoloniferum]